MTMPGATGGAPNGAGGGSGQGGGVGPSPWSVESLQPEDRGWLENKRYPSLAETIRAHRSAEGLLGVPKERLLRLPDRDDAPEWADVWKRLGRPDQPDAYELPELQIGEGEADLRAQFKAWAHEAGLNARQAKMLAEKFVGHASTMRTSDEQAYQQRSQLAMQELRSEWGPEFDKNIRLAQELYQRASQPVGYGNADEMQADFAKIERQMGTKRMMKLMAFLGRGLGEHGYVEGESGGRGQPGGAFGDTTPDAARREFDALVTDVAFMQRYKAGDQAAVEKFQRVARLASPGVVSSGMRT